MGACVAASALAAPLGLSVVAVRPICCGCGLAAEAGSFAPAARPEGPCGATLAGRFVATDWVAAAPALPVVAAAARAADTPVASTRLALGELCATAAFSIASAAPRALAAVAAAVVRHGALAAFVASAGASADCEARWACAVAALGFAAAEVEVAGVLAAAFTCGVEVARRGGVSVALGWGVAAV